MDEACALDAKPLAQPRNALRETKKIPNLQLRNAAAEVLDVTLQAQLRATLGEKRQTRAMAFLDSQRRPEPHSQTAPRATSATAGPRRDAAGSETNRAPIRARAGAPRPHGVKGGGNVRFGR